MAEKKTSSNVTHLRAVTEPSHEGPKSLEARLEEARAKRAKVLAAKGKPDKAPLKPTKPWLDAGQSATEEDDFDPAARAASLVDPTPVDVEIVATPTLDVEIVPEDDVMLSSEVDPAPQPEPEVTVPEAAPEALPAPAREHRVVRAGLLGLVGGLALVAGAAITNLDRLPELAGAALEPEVIRIANDTPPTVGDYLGWDPMVIRPGTDALPVIGALTYPTGFDPGARPVLPERGIEIPLAARLAIGDATLDIPPSFQGRVRVFAPIALPEAQLERVTDFLSSKRLDLGAVTPVSFAIEGNQVRYYHRDDRPTAQALARLMGASVRQYPVKRDEPREPGILELWIAGQ